MHEKSFVELFKKPDSVCLCCDGMEKMEKRGIIYLLFFALRDPSFFSLSFWVLEISKVLFRQKGIIPSEAGFLKVYFVLF